MAVESGQQYNIGEFLGFSVLVANLKKTTLLYTVADPACGLLNRENMAEQKEQMVKRASRDASTCLDATQVSASLVLVQDFFGSSTRPIGVASQSTSRRKITTFLVYFAPLFSWRCLAAFSSSLFDSAISLRPPSVTVSISIQSSSRVQQW